MYDADLCMKVKRIQRMQFRSLFTNSLHKSHFVVNFRAAFKFTFHLTIF